MTLPGKIYSLVVVFSLTAAVCLAQKPLKVDVDIVMLNVSVANAANQFVDGLKADSFQLFEDKV